MAFGGVILWGNVIRLFLSLKGHKTVADSGIILLFARNLNR
jgi:hypothetical protein